MGSPGEYPEDRVTRLRRNTRVAMLSSWSENPWIRSLDKPLRSRKWQVMLWVLRALLREKKRKRERDFFIFPKTPCSAN